MASVALPGLVRVVGLHTLARQNYARGVSLLRVRRHIAYRVCLLAVTPMCVDDRHCRV